MRKSIVILVALLLLIIVVTSISYAWNDVLGPKGSKGRGGKRGVAEPVSIGLVGLGLAGIGIYALMKRKKG